VTEATEKTAAQSPGNWVQFADSPFALLQPWPPAGDQPAAIAALVDGVQNGEVFQTLLGVTGSGKTFTMAQVIARLGRPAIVFAPNKTLAAQLYSEFREFFPKNAVEYFVSYYDYYQPEAYVPQRDLFIEKDSAINAHIEQMRLSCTKSLLERRDVVIVATVSAIYGIGEPQSYHQMVLTLRAGSRLNQREAIAQLVRMQYRRNDQDFARSTFRVRGDIIDIFPAEHSELALRVALFDDEIDTLQLFDPLTGHIRQNLARFTVYPGSHYVTPRDKVLAAVETIKLELAQRLQELQAAGKLVEAQRLAQRTRFDLEMLAEVGHCKGIENYSRHLSGTAPGEPPSTLTDYLPPDALMQQVALVFQDSFLFSTSIADNIRLGCPEATLEQVQNAARAAQAHEFIEQLPKGYDTHAGERGVFLSGGQRQRITIARAILQNRPVLVLDEATAFADPENEAAIVAALSHLMRGKTVLMVAHRLSTIRDADQILVFERGCLVERGRHDDLLRNDSGLYARLWDSYQQAQHWALRGAAPA